MSLDLEYEANTQYLYPNSSELRYKMFLYVHCFCKKCFYLSLLLFFGSIILLWFKSLPLILLSALNATILVSLFPMIFLNKVMPDLLLWECRGSRIPCPLQAVRQLLSVMCDKKLYLRLRINPPPFRLVCLYCSMRSWLTGGCEAYRTTWRKMEP